MIKIDIQSTFWATSARARLQLKIHLTQLVTAGWGKDGSTGLFYYRLQEANDHLRLRSSFFFAAQLVTDASVNGQQANANQTHSDIVAHGQLFSKK